MPTRRWTGLRCGVNYAIRIKGSAARELARIPPQTRDLLSDAIDSLSQQPLGGRPLRGNLRGLRRVRVGSYRIVYEVRPEEQTALVVRVAHRSSAYRQL